MSNTITVEPGPNIKVTLEESTIGDILEFENKYYIVTTNPVEHKRMAINLETGAYRTGSFDGTEDLYTPVAKGTKITLVTESWVDSRNLG